MLNLIINEQEKELLLRVLEKKKKKYFRMLKNHKQESKAYKENKEDLMIVESLLNSLYK